MRVYFKGLKFLRFIAASMVVVHHIEQYKCKLGIPNLWSNGVIRNLGDKGVTLFFVLSGFLITFLLLKEKEQTGKINIKYFYFRRVLRIWPLYFLVVFSSIFLFPHLSFFRTNETSVIENKFLEILLLSICILPNMTMLYVGAIPFSSQTWSIGVEEQFYIVWPVLIKYTKHIFFLLLGIIGLLFILQNSGVLIPRILGQNIFSSTYLMNQATFFRFLRIDCMAFGGLGALLVFKKSKLLKYIYSPITSTVLLILVVWIVFSDEKIFLFDNVIQSCLYMFLILTIATYDKCFYTIETKLFNVLGDISYGIYMYHPIVCFMVLKLIGKELNYLSSFCLIFIFTLLLAYVSYMLFEKRLINIKSQKFAIVKNT